MRERGKERSRFAEEEGDLHGSVERVRDLGEGQERIPSLNSLSLSSGEVGHMRGRRPRRFDAPFSLLAIVISSLACLAVVLYNGRGYRSPTDSLMTTKNEEREDFLAQTASSIDGGDASLHVPRTIDGIMALAKRRVPLEDLDLLEFQLDDDGAETEYFTITVVNGATLADARRRTVQIKGNSISALSRGLETLYRAYCDATLVSWVHAARPARPCLRDDSTFDRISSSSMPITSHANFKYRYYLNAVTFSYECTRWTWERWERELDLASLRGVNLMLAHVGQEAVWRRVFLRETGVDLAEEFFTDEAYLAWNRMGNIYGKEMNGGRGVNLTYLDEQERMQARIMRRMSELGIAPILPSFNGFVPRSLMAEERGVSPDGAFWSGFDGMVSNVPRLHRKSEVFRRVGRGVIEEQLRRYGSLLASFPVLFFSLDVYNENPPLPGERFVDVANALYEPFRLAFGRGDETTTKHVTPPPRRFKLVMQLWFAANSPVFWTPTRTRAFLDAWPPDSLLLLDLHGERRPQRRRLGLLPSNVVHVALHTFGNGKGMAGELEKVIEDAKEARMAGVAGIGAAPESLENNELVFDSIWNSGWDSKGEDSSQDFLESWVMARYRVSQWDMSPSERRAALEAWRCAVETVYSRPRRFHGAGTTKSIWELRLTSVPLSSVWGDAEGRRRGWWEALANDQFQPTVFYYERAAFSKCARSLASALLSRGLLLRGGGTTMEDDAMLHDAVDFVRQTISDEAHELLSRLIPRNRTDWERVRRSISPVSRRLRRLVFVDLRAVLCASRAFSRPHAPQVTESDRAVVTVWGLHHNDGTLVNYGSTQSCGELFDEVHVPRLRRFLDGLEEIAERVERGEIAESEAFILDERDETNLMRRLDLDLAKIEKDWILRGGERRRLDQMTRERRFEQFVGVLKRRFRL